MNQNGDNLLFMAIVSAINRQLNRFLTGLKPVVDFIYAHISFEFLHVSFRYLFAIINCCTEKIVSRPCVCETAVICCRGNRHRVARTNKTILIKCLHSSLKSPVQSGQPTHIINLLTEFNFLKWSSSSSSPPPRSIALNSPNR